jgi:hypothetical protein
MLSSGAQVLAPPTIGMKWGGDFKPPELFPDFFSMLFSLSDHLEVIGTQRGFDNPYIKHSRYATLLERGSGFNLGLGYRLAM